MNASRPPSRSADPTARPSPGAECRDHSQQGVQRPHEAVILPTMRIALNPPNALPSLLALGALVVVQVEQAAHAGLELVGALRPRRPASRPARAPSAAPSSGCAAGPRSACPSPPSWRRPWRRPPVRPRRPRRPGPGPSASPGVPCRPAPRQRPGPALRPPDQRRGLLAALADVGQLVTGLVGGLRRAEQVLGGLLPGLRDPVQCLLRVASPALDLVPRPAHRPGPPRRACSRPRSSRATISWRSRDRLPEKLPEIVTSSSPPATPHHLSTGTR